MPPPAIPVRHALFLVAVLSLVPSLPGHERMNDWLIIPGVRVGSITPATNRAGLVRIFGAKNVVDEDVTVSDAGPEPGTAVYKDRPEDSIAIFWARDKPGQRIDFLVFCPPQFFNIQKPCRWHTQDNIRFGTTLKELERLNGRAFTILGFAWDYEGSVTSWNGGALETRLDAACGGLGLRVTPSLGEHPAPAELALADQLSGDKPFSSAVKAMQELNPQVSWMSMSFKNCTH